ncbi:MAG: GtrA family protein [Corynebacterium sp.]|nr:GtrA family protein [Corynebacterium sp.]
MQKEQENTSVTKDVASQGIKFIISGAISAVVDLGLTALFQYKFGFGEAGARTIGFIFGTIVAYMINRRWTFKAEPSTKRMVQVAILYCITYFVNVLGYKYGFIGLRSLGLAEALATLIAFCAAQGTATVINFVVQRVWIFNNPKK